MSNLFQLDALAAVKAQVAGEISAEELAADCLARIDEFDQQVKAWAHLNREHVLAQARELDRHRRAGLPVGPLHGIPVGIKDIIDTFDYPTEMGTSVHAGRMAAEDATVVMRLRQAGAVIMGKTVTTEFAMLHPAGTTNPHDPARTPGGSSSGSAAAVASFMVPLALGTQTNGSVIRPASFCGTVGYKPTFGLVSRHRVNRTSRSLDQMGVFARSVGDAALAAEVLIGFDENDRSMRQVIRQPLVELALSEPLMEPRFAFVKGPAWDRADDDTTQAFAELVDVLDDRVVEIDLASVFDEVFAWHKMVMDSEIALNLGPQYDRGPENFSESFAATIASGRAVHAVDYALALERMEMFGIALGEIFEEFDAILTPAAPGEAPLGLDSTGDPAFSTLWTFAGMPAITLPLLAGSAGMPMGVQLVGARHDDARLLRSANWLVNRLQ